jgi:hypothetical protein
MALGAVLKGEHPVAHSIFLDQVLDFRLTKIRVVTMQILLREVSE